MSPQETLKDRDSVHGDFAVQAVLAERLKLVMQNSPYWLAATPVQREALAMIAVKISRIVCGNPLYKDHWHDIQGYALLAEQELNHPIQADTPRHAHNEEARGKGFYGHALPSTPDEYR